MDQRMGVVNPVTEETSVAMEVVQEVEEAQDLAFRNPPTCGDGRSARFLVPGVRPTQVR